MSRKKTIKLVAMWCKMIKLPRKFGWLRVKDCLVKAGLFPRRTRNFSIDATLKTPFDHPTKRFLMRTLSYRRFWIENFTTRHLDAWSIKSNSRKWWFRGVNILKLLALFGRIIRMFLYYESLLALIHSLPLTWIHVISNSVFSYR